MTANLDGETSLKTRYSASLTKQAKDVKQLVNMYGCIECENPNPKLDSFLGRLTMWTCREGDEPEVCHQISIFNELRYRKLFSNSLALTLS